MKRISTTIMGLAALVAMLVLGVFSAGAAQAHTFLWTGATPSLLLILAEGPQTFTPASGVPPVICKHMHLDGTIKAESQLAATAHGTYTGCTVEGLAANVSEAEYEFSADETVSVTGKTIVIEVPLAACKIDVTPALNQNLSTIKYLVDPNSSSLRILAHVEVAKIHSVTLGGGGLCGAEGLHTTGTYFGLVLAWAHNPGTLKWS